MSLRSLLSSIATGAVLIGLTGISSPAFAAAPTVTIDSSGSGCGTVANVEFDGYSQTQFFADFWTDGTTSNISANITCNGTQLDLQWQSIFLYADTPITLVVPDLSDVAVTEHDGLVTSPWGSDCLGTQYPVGVRSFAATAESEDVTQPQVSITEFATLSPDGSFTIDVIDGVSTNVGYPFQDDNGDYVGQTDYESGWNFSEKCTAYLSGNMLSVFEADEDILLVNDTAQVDYVADYPDGFNSAGCSFSDPDEYVSVYRGQDTVEAEMNCAGYQIWLQTEFALTAGQLNVVTFDVPPLNEVTISGTIDFAHPECLTSSLYLTNSAMWDWSRTSDAPAVESDGSFTFTGPAGVYQLQTVSSSDDGDNDEYLGNLCAITSRTLGYVSEDMTGVTLESDTVKVTTSLSQPFVNESDGECSLYYPNTEGVVDTETRYFATSKDATTLGFTVWCGTEMERRFSMGLTSTGANTATTGLTVPNIEMVTITGAFKLPKSYPANRVRDLSISVSPEYYVGSGAQGGWQAQIQPEINTQKKTYTVTMPAGNYTFGISTQVHVPRNQGCYVYSYYPGTTIQFAQPVTISTTTSRAPTVELLLGGRIKGRATFDESITREITTFDDTVYNMEGTSFSWFAGDSTMVDEDGDFEVFQCFPPGKYYYQAGQISDGVKSQFYGGVTAMENATPVVIPGGGVDAKPISMHFMPLDGGTISGVVTDGDGDPLIEATVLAYDLISGSFSSRVTDVDGSYTITGLNTPGEYTIVAFENRMWFGADGTNYAYFPSNTKETAVSLYLTKSNPEKAAIDVTIDGSLPAKAIYDLWPWFQTMNVPAPAENFDGVTEALLDGTVTVDTENIQIVEDTRHRIGALEGWELDVDVNFNSVQDNTVGAYGFSGGDTPSGLGDVPAVNDQARVIGAIDLAEGLNFVTVTGSESGDTVAVPIVFGALEPTMLTLPTKTGTVKVGKKVTADPGVWVAGPEITRTSYQWMSCKTAGTVSGCKPISGAKKASYSISSKVKGKFLAIKVTATNGVATTVAIHSFGKVR